MATIFECETELGRCDSGSVPSAEASVDAACAIYAHTTASLNRRMLKIEQRCYLRADDVLPEQPWVKPKMIIEPAVCSREELLKMVEEIHENFVARARSQIPALAP